MHFVAIKMGRRQGGPSRTGGGSGAYLNRYVTDEQRSRRPIFIATLRAVASWLFFCVAHSTRMIQIGALRSRLEKQGTAKLSEPRRVVIQTHQPRLRGATSLGHE